MRVERRLLRLERAVEQNKPTLPCAECGAGPVPSASSITVVFEEPQGPDRCQGCGRQLVFVVEFDHAG